jgi:hypothetical protein
MRSRALPFTGKNEKCSMISSRGHPQAAAGIIQNSE